MNPGFFIPVDYLFAEELFVSRVQNIEDMRATQFNGIIKECFSEAYTFWDSLDASVIASYTLAICSVDMFVSNAKSVVRIEKP